MPITTIIMLVAGIEPAFMPCSSMFSSLCARLSELSAVYFPPSLPSRVLASH
ncbi:hypothetical protein OQN31_02420 [Citrobacter freundii]|uniref:hypothetical protein n=1 Tax=Citrobacter freundii TaxID=546 RepID=UPI00155EDAEE|nr:hypothetical protein [Citrobacter freundii]EKV6293373.1 hypothetical protein [Citrobacter freundii]EKW9108984.1 hypothetical protein [Citrobacter freundii]MBJ8964972.1 hypothetical protein [Citrobacter freundii]MBJ9148462.1 hypothetical protein [Citrobacter freundii]MCX3155577.1 hypothetical protein [Citrobacter freundii]